jgi:hypothetical protein
MTLNGIHSVVFQKRGLYVTILVGNSNSTNIAVPNYARIVLLCYVILLYAGPFYVLI